MSATQFIRRAAVTVTGKDGIGKRLDGIRVSFKVDKTAENTPNQAEIEVYNLSPASRSLFEKKWNKVLLEAGYDATGKASLPAVFFGDISKAFSERRGADIVTKITAGDGEDAFRNSTVDLSFKKNTSAKSAIGAVISTFQGLITGKTDAIPDATIPKGISLSGPSRDVLDRLTDRFDLDWSIQDKELVIVPRKAPNSGEVPLVSPDTGLIGIPAVENQILRFDCLMRPDIRPYRAFQLESQKIKCTTIAMKVTHEGDTRGPAWKSSVEARIYG